MPDFFHLVVSPPENSVLYAGSYDPVLVCLSVLVAIFASYAALLVSRHIVITTNTKKRRMWVAGGALCLGIGIWAMHFVGMLAFSLPCSSSYDAVTTLLSTIPGIFASAIALNTISRRELTRSQLATGGILIGVGIGAMHYSGMAAMRLNGLIRYNAWLFLLSILIAIVLATLALWIKFRLQSWQSRWNTRVTAASAVVMGLAVSGMHYTAMAAAYFIRDGDSSAVTSGIAPAFLAAIVLVATSLIIVVSIVATYIENAHLRYPTRPYRLVGVLIASWVIIAWLSADYFYNRLADNLYQTESQLAEQNVEQVASNIDESIALLKGISLIVSGNEDTRRALRRFGPDVAPSALAYEQRQQSWTRDTVLGAVSRSLDSTATNLKGDVLWIVNAAGDCIASSNAGQPDSFVGTNYADRDYFRQAQAGQRGHQYAVGRASNIPGLYYSYPVMESGRFLGAVVIKRNIAKYSSWIDPANAFIADNNGIIVLAADKRLELRYLPNASVVSMPAAQRLLLYKQSAIEPVAITPWNDSRFPSAVLIGEATTPIVLSTRNLPEDAITVYASRSLDEVARLDTEQIWFFLLLSAAGSMLIIASAAVVVYLREARREEMNLRISAIAFESQEGMLVTDASSVILRVNRAFTAITGYTAEEVVGQTPRILSSGRQDGNFYALMWKSLNESGGWEGEIWNRRKSGEIYPEYLTITAVRDREGVITNYVAAITDISMRKAADNEIKNLAFYDPLTGLPNRRLLMDRFFQALAASARSGHAGALMFIDLDHFKTLNDTLGHDVGDLLLQQVAERLTGCMREGDTVARLGGDEFVVMLEDLSSQPLEAAEQAETVGEKILSSLDQRYQLGTYDCRSTPSIGVTLFHGHQSGVDELIKQADIAMYQAKKAGRNTLRFFDPAMQSALTAHAALESDLRYAVAMQEDFQLYYQAQVNEAGRVIGAEVLLRWVHPTRGMVSPAEFIPLAEETGLILPLGHWVMLNACQQLAAWAADPATAHLTLAVNVSAKQFRLSVFVDEVVTLIDHFGIDPAKLKLEITESMLLDNVDDIIAKMILLKARGMNFSLDDFGTGYSSLQYLKRLPLDQIKIDKSFLRDIATDNSDKAIVRTIIAMAHSLNLDVIAEGVETEEQRKILLRKGCMHYQGYLFGKPVPLDQFEASLKPGNAV